MENVKKRILSITGALILFVGAVICVLFPRKTDTVASAEGPSVGSQFYTIPLPTYNSIYWYQYSYAPMPLVALIGPDYFALVQSTDGVSIDFESFSVESESIVYQQLYPSSGEHDVVLPMYLHSAGLDKVSAKVAVYAGSYGLKDLPNTTRYRPYKVTGYYIFPPYTGGVVSNSYVFFDYYVDYINLDTKEVVRGAGFSIRLPYSTFGYPAYSFNSAFLNFYEVSFDELPKGNKLVYSADAIGYTYYQYGEIFERGELYGYDVGYESGRADGYTQGESAGYESGRADGYTQGESAGYENGYNVGYNKGLEVSGKYNFTSLISSVIDVPINAFRSLFNFEILGINMATFFFSLFTLAILLTVVRYLL